MPFAINHSCPEQSGDCFSMQEKQSPEVTEKSPEQRPGEYIHFPFHGAQRHETISVQGFTGRGCLLSGPLGPLPFSGLFGSLVAQKLSGATVRPASEDMTPTPNRKAALGIAGMYTGVEYRYAPCGTTGRFLSFIMEARCVSVRVLLTAANLDAYRTDSCPSNSP